MYKRLIGISLICSFMLSSTLTYAANVATVNGKPITQAEYEQYLAQRKKAKPNDPANNNRNAVINEMVNRNILYQEALKKKLDKNPEVAYILQEQRTETLIRALLSKSDAAKPIPEAEVKKLYDDRIKAMPSKEYKARHILLKTEADAKAAIAELDGGAVFEDVAKAKSTGPSAANGGDLGWFNPAQMVPPFSQAVSEMKKGTYTKKPVQTQFGWHVIKLEDSRKLDPPKYEEVKPQLEAGLRSQKLQNYVKGLRDKAKVEIK